MILLNSRTLHYNELVLFGTLNSTAEHVKQAQAILNARKDAFKRSIITTLPLKDFQKAVDGLLDKSLDKMVLTP